MDFQPDFLCILESLKDGVIVSDLKGEIIFANETARKFFTGSLPVIIGTNSDLENWVRALAAGEKIDDRETIIERRGKEAVDVLISIYAYLSREQAVSGILQVIRDVTPAKKLKVSLQERNAILVNANKELEQFAYIASHDLQQELRNITNFTGLLTEHTGPLKDEAFKMYLSIVSGSAQKANSLINELLKYSRIGNHRHVTNFSSGGALSAAIEKLQPMVDETKASITFGEMPVLEGDAKQIELVFEQLLKNGLIFKQPLVDPALHIECNSAAHCWKFSVRDNGIGIQEENWGKIFSVFTRLHTLQDYPGIGMGLTVCKKIIEQHGGSIWLNSQIGVGSSFCFTIPHSKI